MPRAVCFGLLLSRGAGPGLAGQLGLPGGDDLEGLAQVRASFGAAAEGAAEDDARELACLRRLRRERLRVLGLEMGFDHVASGPMVRSSYHADVQAHEAGIG